MLDSLTGAAAFGQRVSDRRAFMNAQLLNPFARDTPDRIESSLENACATCLAFNHGRGLFAGQYLAVGRSDHYVAIYDLEVRSILRWFLGHVKPITSVSWSPYGRYLASSSLDWNVNLWDLRHGPAKCVRTLRFTAPVLQVQFSPISSRTLLVLLESREAFLICFPTWQDVQNSTVSTQPRRIALHDTPDISAACFTPDGRWILTGTLKGAIRLIDAQDGQLMHDLPCHIGSSMIREIALDEQSRHIAVNMNDRTIRTLQVMYNDAGEMPIGLKPTHKFQDLVSRTPWSGIGFSRGAEYVIGGAAQDPTHNIYIWDTDAGVLVKILEGPREPLVCACWHPIKPLMASIASFGDVYIWSIKTNEIWSAYAPGFEELEKNVEYDEPENEFDLDEETDDTRQRQEEADIVNLFANGPVPETSLPPIGVATDLARTHSTLAAELRPAAAWSPDMFRDDDDQVAFIIPPLLEDYTLDEDVKE